MKTISLIGALWTSNFGDVLLADLFKKRVERSGKFKTILPNSSPSVLAELSAEKSSFYQFIKSDAAVFVGGGYLSEPHQKPMRWVISRYKLIFMYATLCRIFRKPYAFYCVGVGPCTTWLSKFIFRHVAKGATHVVVRDHYSQETLKKINIVNNVSLSFDYAISLPKLSPPKGKLKVALHLTSKQQALNEFIISYFKNNNIDITFIEDHPGEYERVKKTNPSITNLANDSVLHYQNFQKTLEVLSKFNFIVTSKLHVGIISSHYGLKVCSFPYHPKVQRFYKEICRSDALHETSGITEMECHQHISRCINGNAIDIPDSVYERITIAETTLDEFLSKI